MAHTKLIDMARDAGGDDMLYPFTAGAPPVPQYDHGLHVAFSHDTLLKLNLDDDVDVGDTLDIRALAKVTSVSKNDTGGGMKCRVEMQLTHIGLPENESTEYDDGNDNDEY